MFQSDAYQATGCYNLLCSGFVQTNNRIAIGAAISPTSSYNGGQFDISLLVWKVINLNFNHNIKALSLIIFLDNMGWFSRYRCKAMITNKDKTKVAVFI